MAAAGEQQRGDWRGRETGGWRSREPNDWRGRESREEYRVASPRIGRRVPHATNIIHCHRNRSATSRSRHSAFGQSEPPRYFGTGAQGHGGGPSFTGGTYGTADWRSDSPYFDEVGFNRGNYEDPLHASRKGGRSIDKVAPARAALAKVGTIRVPMARAGSSGAIRRGQKATPALTSDCGKISRSA